MTIVHDDGSVTVVEIKGRLAPKDVVPGVMYVLPADQPEHVEREFVTHLKDAGASKDLIEAAQESLA